MFLLSPVSERRTGAHHQQLSSGCPAWALLGGSMLWDLALHAAFSLCLVLSFAVMGDQVGVRPKPDPPAGWRCIAGW